MTQREWSDLFPFHFGSVIERQARLTLCREGDTDRAKLEAFIHARFESIHHADVHHYLPELIGLEDSHGRLIAAAGIRPANQGPLFLEHYLDEPLECVVSRLARRAVGREQLVEVGNLAALSAGSARVIITAVTWLLAARDLHWVAFTGASTLVNSFHRLGLEPTVIAEADPHRLSGELASWGSYYAQHPQVYAGNIRYGHDELERTGVYKRMGFPHLLLEAGHAA
ncbi:thermostable hemolysin [Pseudomonas nitroreducens]|uniref:thermostable hemolysin n=1 Tax=Pseudomonas nitroreducens TaxID=46680 RepID=UPI003D290E5F